MAKKLSKALRTDLNQMAALLRSKGRNGDTILAHINPKEAALLKARGGSGKPNPETGLPEFQEYADFGGDTGPSWWDKFTDTFSFGGGGDTSGQDLSQYNIEVPETPSYEAPVSSTFDQYGVSPDVGADWFQQYQQQFTQPQAATGGFGTAEPFVGKAQFAEAPQFGAQGVPVTPGYAASQIDAMSPPEQKGFLESAEELAKKYPKTTGTLESILGTAGKIGLGALGSIPIQRTQRTAAQQSAQMGKEIGALGAPQKAIGTQMLAQAEAGQLTPQQQQSLAATRAQQKQALARAGVTSGTAAQQAEANAQRLAQTYISQNIDNALKMIQFGDRYVAQGIKAGYDANQQANQAANIFYQNMFGMLGGTGNILRG